jgi:uncharacterized iron-regulated protein
MKLNSRLLIFLILIVFSPALSPLYAHAIHKNQLYIDVDIINSQINGISRIGVSAGEEVLLRKGSLEVFQIKLDNRPITFKDHDDTIKVVPGNHGIIEVYFRGVFNGVSLSETDTGIVRDVIDDRGVSLTGVWYPYIDGIRHYDLTVALPEGYIAVSEAESIEQEVKNGKVEFHFNYPHPVDSISLVASNKYKILKDSFRDIEIYAYFFEEDLALGKTYIEYTRKYLELYEDLIGEYPYQRFSIVENFLPSGYSMPTFTLLGSAVVRLPFIVETSLGHEVLHQWFGNHVYIDYENGNWAEGLTTYLADHLYKVRKGEGWKYRKQVLIDYKSYVSVKNDFPLKSFRSRVDRASRATRSGKVALIFHMLQNLTGKKIFYEALKDFIGENRLKRASWNDIRNSFEKKYGQDLEWFFTQWIDREGLPELKLEDAEVKQIGTDFELHFHVNHQKTFYKLALPVNIYINDTIKMDTLNIDSAGNSFDFLLPDKPDKIVLDEDYDIARNLEEKEFPPVIARLLGEEKIVLFFPAGKEEIYQTIIDNFKMKGAVVSNAEEFRDSDIASSSVVILDYENPLIERLYGKLSSEDGGFSVIVKANPWNSQKAAVIINGKSKREVDAAFKKIRHYGKYSRLVFSNGRNIKKEIQESQRGIVMEFDNEAAVIDISSIKKLSDVIADVADKRIIYVGEVHDVFAHHAVQLDIITGVYKKNRKIAIGMEMFQKPFQEILDTFIAGRMGEQQFLKKSEYFKRWSFDYNLYKPILDFARTERIPVIALNLKREIIEKVSKSGTGALSEEEKREIPSEMDFSDNTYRDRIKEVFSLHKHSEKSNFDFFYQSQILWDETMSQSVDEFLQKNGEYQMVVLAGQGHLRYGSGIPKRTHRRNGADYAVVLIDDKVEEGIADYVVFPKPVEGFTTPKLMVFLKMKDGKFEIADFPEKSVSEKAGLKIGDIILFIDDIEMKSVEDIKIYLLYKRKGDKIKVKIDRKEKEMEIEVEL